MSERRRCPRRAGPDVPWAEARVRPGRDVVVVDLGAGGARVEGPTRLMPGARVVLQLRAQERMVAVSGQVVRCEVAVLDQQQGIRYLSALRFDGLVPPLE